MAVSEGQHHWSGEDCANGQKGLCVGQIRGSQTSSFPGIALLRHRLTNYHQQLLKVKAFSMMLRSSQNVPCVRSCSVKSANQTGLHTSCKNCLEAWLSRQRKGQLSCPRCRPLYTFGQKLQILDFKGMVQKYRGWAGAEMGSVMRF